MKAFQFSGNLIYDGLSTSTKVQRFLNVGEELIILDLTNPAEREGSSPTRFFGSLEKQADSSFRSGWIYLSSTSGQDLSKDSELGARIILDLIQFQNSDEVRIEGRWITFNEVEYRFHGLLHRDETLSINQGQIPIQNNSPIGGQPNHI